VRIGDNGRDIVERNAAKFAAFLGDGHKAAIDGEMMPVTCDFDHASNHRPSSLKKVCGAGLR
jgi:hypothetical protein